jgi:hypothetical protein
MYCCEDKVDEGAQGNGQESNPDRLWVVGSGDPDS